MKWLIIFMAAFSSFLLFVGLLQMFFLRDKRLAKRMKRYLAMGDKKGFDRKKLNLLVQMQMTKQRIRKQMLTKDKNSKLEVLLSRAGVPLKPEEYVIMQWISSALVAGISFLLTGAWFLMLPGFFLGFLLPKWYVLKKERERINKFNEGLADMITTIVGSLRAGFSFPQALKTVAEEAHSPIKEEMETVLREMQYGASMEDALHSLKERVPSEDLDLMIQAILIQRQVGGNLATVLDQIVRTIRDRTKIHRQISTLTAQGRLSGIVVGLLPIILTLVLYIIEPGYMKALFTHPVGIMMVVGGAISAGIGFFLIRKLTSIEV
ncbi:type II secretion system protein [Bacillus sp. HMF5848]|uniref:type II secretion system F family protein n=1 Tax=Bacillus sp. HMF5848 TaxID=2495421 RepID=UPI000F79517F|nr:type II secretion system F family protein [Bacillus sp. HMF5848]RSK26377.1 type II secretion system protein [Bacillus sp. HMF5848]